MILSISVAPFTNYGLNLILARISNYIHYKVWDEITSQTSTINNGWLVGWGNTNFSSSTFAAVPNITDS